MSGLPIHPRIAAALPLHVDATGPLPLHPPVASPKAPADSAGARTRAQVRRLSHDLEGVFLNQLFQAMRASVPNAAPGSDAPAQQLFDAMLDETMAERAAQRSNRGIGEALYHQLERRLGGAGPNANANENQKGVIR
jgi:Rod binding domain-containing protein